MIPVTRLCGQTTWINVDQVRSVESTPDTLIVFMDGETLRIKESPAQVNQSILSWKRKVEHQSLNSEGFNQQEDVHCG